MCAPFWQPSHTPHERPMRKRSTGCSGKLQAGTPQYGETASSAMAATTIGTTAGVAAHFWQRGSAREIQPLRLHHARLCGFRQHPCKARQTQSRQILPDDQHALGHRHRRARRTDQRGPKRPQHQMAGQSRLTCFPCPIKLRGEAQPRGSAPPATPQLDIARISWSKPLQQEMHP